MKVLSTQRDPKEWQQFVELLTVATYQGRLEEVLAMLLTADECNALGLRVQIVRALLDNKSPQREIQQQLNTSAATITRGSNMLKTVDPEILAWVNQQLNGKA